MDFRRLVTKREKREFIDFYYNMYKGDKAFVDTDAFVLKDFLFCKTQIAKDFTIIPTAVFSDGVKVCQCMLFANDNSDSLYLGYFDALENKNEAVSFLISEAIKIASEQNKKELVIGINGHLSCGVGILQNNFNKKATFDSRYNKEWYKEYFADFPFKSLTAFSGSLTDLSGKWLSRTNKLRGYRFFDPKNFDFEMEIFSRLCNQTLINTNYYYPMKPYHMQNMLIGMKPFMKKENLIFVMDGEKEVGFLFWHPDYNELFCAGKKNNLLSVGFRYLFKKVEGCKINAIGVLDEYKNTFALYTLFYVFSQCACKHKNLETTFIWDDNLDSFALTKNRLTPLKAYKVYTVPV